MSKEMLLLATWFNCFFLLSCDKTTRTEYTLDHIVSQDSIAVAKTIGKEPKIGDNKLHSYASILEEKGKIYRTTVYYGLSNNKNETIAVVRIFEEDSSQFTSMKPKRLHITFEGDISEISSDYGQVAQRIISMARNGLVTLKEDGKKETEKW